MGMTSSSSSDSFSPSEVENPNEEKIVEEISWIMDGDGEKQKWFMVTNKVPFLKK